MCICLSEVLYKESLNIKSTDDLFLEDNVSPVKASLVCDQSYSDQSQPRTNIPNVTSISKIGESSGFRVRVRSLLCLIQNTSACHVDNHYSDSVSISTTGFTECPES